MQNNNGFRFTYYSILNTLGFGLCIALASMLTWPLLAEFSLILSVYILIVAFGKYLFNSSLIQSDFDLANIIRDLRFQLKQLEDVEKG